MNQNGLVGGRGADDRDDGVFGEGEGECLFPHDPLPFVLSCPPLPRSSTIQLFWAGQLLSTIQRVFLMLALASAPLDFGELPEGRLDLSPLFLSLALRWMAGSALPLFPPMAARARAPAFPLAASLANIRGIDHGWP